MYRSRGKPHDPWNRAAAEKQQQLAESIQIKPLYNREMMKLFELHNQRAMDESMRRKLHFEEFKETYQQRFQKSQEKNHTLKSRMVSSVNKWMDEQCTYNDKYDFGLANRINLRCKMSMATNTSKPVMLRAPIRSIKTVQVEVPTWTNMAVVKPPKKKKDGSSILERLQKIEKEKYHFNVEEGVQVDLVKELKETKVEIDVAESQLEQIQNLLKQKRLLELEEPKMEEKKSEPERMKTKWSLNNVKSRHSSKAGKNRLLSALKTVNSRLQKMQEQYFIGPTHKFKSLKQVTNNLADVDIIYKNKKFATNIIDSTMAVSKDASGKEISPVIKKYILHSLFHNNKDKSPSISPKSSPRRILADRPVSPLKIIEEHDTHCKDSVDIIMPPKKIAKNTGSTIKPIKEGGDLELGTMLMSSSLKDSIIKSDFLMREFGGKKSENLSSLFKTRKSSGIKKSVRFSAQKLVEKISDKEVKKSDNSQQMREAIQHALKHTLYSV